MKRHKRSRVLETIVCFGMAATISSAPVSRASAKSAAGPAVATRLRTYESPSYQWSVTYPDDWQLDETRADAVRITSDELRALCGVYAAPVRFDDPDSFADFMLKHMADELRDQKGLQSETLWRRDIRLRTGQPAVEALVAIHPGGTSHRLFVASANQGFGIDCEAEEANWPEVSHTFDQIIASFGLSAVRPAKEWL